MGTQFHYLTKSKTNMEQKNNYNFRLDILRRRIDVLDDELYGSIKKRFNDTNLIGKLKREYHITDMCEKRKEEIYGRLETKCIDDGLPPQLLKDIYNLIFEYSIKDQKRIIGEK